MASLAEHVADMEADRPFADVQFIGNLLVRQIAADQSQDVQFPVSQGNALDAERDLAPDVRDVPRPSSAPGS